MSTDREVTRIVRSWLEEGVNALPDRVLDNVLDRVPATPQRRPWWLAWRLPLMNTQLRIAVAAAAMVVLALIVINVLPKSGGVGGQPTGPSPTPGSLTGVIVPMKPGTYIAAEPFLVRATFTLPTGWEGGIGGPYLVALDQAPQGLGSVSFSIFTDVAADPCHFNGFANPPVGPSVDDLATALASLPGVTATTPTVATLGGYQGKQLTLTAPASFAGCTLSPDGAFRIWQLPLGATDDMSPSEVDKIWILQVGGQRLVIDTPQVLGESAADIAAVQGILDSIRLAPASPGSGEAPAPGASTGPSLVDGFAPGTLAVTAGSHAGGFAVVTCQTLSDGQLSVSAGDTADGEFVGFVHMPDGSVPSLYGILRGVEWQVTRNAQVSLKPDMKSGSFSGMDASGETVSGSFACS